MTNAGNHFRGCLHYTYIYYIYPLICDAMSPYKYFPSIADIDTFSLRIDSAPLDVMGIV